MIYKIIQALRWVWRTITEVFEADGVELEEVSVISCAACGDLIYTEYPKLFWNPEHKDYLCDDCYEDFYPVAWVR